MSHFLALLIGSNWVVALAYVYTPKYSLPRFEKTTHQFAGNDEVPDIDKYQRVLSDYIENHNNDTKTNFVDIKPYEVFCEESELFTKSDLLDFSPFGSNELNSTLLLSETSTEEDTVEKGKGIDQELSDSKYSTEFGITSRAWENLEEDKEKGEDSTPSSVDQPKTKAWQFLEDVIEDVEENYNKPVLTLEEYFKGEPLEEEHQENIEQLWSMIQNRGSISSLSEEGTSKILNALTLAYITLWGKKTSRSMEKQINRAAGVAAVLGDLRQPTYVILAGILNEVITTLISIKAFDHIGTLVQLFGRQAISLADMYSRLPKFFARKTEYSPMQSENQVQMLVQASEDPTVLLLRLADRLHSMRYLGSMPLDDLDRVKISHESLNVYAPLAHKMGLMDMKNEFEDLSFEHLQPIEFEKATCTQTDAHKAYHDAANSITDILSHDPLLLSMNTTFKLTYRVKARYQLYCKMLRRGLKSCKDVRDALGLRIIVSTPKQPSDSMQDHIKRGADVCYYLVERLRNMPGWEPEPDDGFKDYIGGAKDNGYQSLHQYIRHVALNSNVEVQVRTQAMHQYAELGEAAHWCYKDLIYRPEIANSRYYKIAWRSPRQMKVKTPQELIGLARIQLKQTRVFVYLEDKSTVLNLKRGSTALDAAFSIHTGVGLSTTCIKINGKPVSYGNLLQTGDEVSVKCAPNGQVMAKTSWLTGGLVVSRQAKFALKRYLNENQSSTLVCYGLIQLLMILFNNKDRVEARYGGRLPDALHLQRFAKGRTGMSISRFLAQLGTLSSRGETAVLVQQLLNIPGDELQISSNTMALIWGRMQDSLHGPSVPFINELRLFILHPLVYDILPREDDGVIDAFSQWSQTIGPRMISSHGIEEAMQGILKDKVQVKEGRQKKEKEKKKEVIEIGTPERRDISTEAYDSRCDYRDKVVLSTQVPKKANFYYLQSEGSKTHIYRDYRRCLRDIYTNYPIAAYKRTPHPIYVGQTDPLHPPAGPQGVYVHLLDKERGMGSEREREKEKERRETRQTNRRSCGLHLSPSKTAFQIAKHPYSLEASVLSQNNKELHHFAKRVYADHVNNKAGRGPP